jgi:phosphoglycerate dehydrogenase-like enzyme
MSKSKSGKRFPAAKTHVHIENNRDLGNVFDFTKAALSAAQKRNPASRKRLTFTVGYDGDSLEGALRTADALIGWNFDRADLARRAPRLKWVHSIGAGVEHMLPLDWMPGGVTLTNNRGVHAERAMEYVAAVVLMLNNRIPEMVTHQQQARWVLNYNTSIRGKTLLILGVGSIGAAAARWATGFGLDVIGIRRSGKPRRGVRVMHRPSALRRLLPRADFVLVATPDTDETHRMLGRAEIGLLKRGAGLVNVGRAGVVDYEALSERLRAGELSAVLDVFDPEPLPSESPLWRTPNLIITPHSSLDDPGYYVPRTLDLIIENALRLADKKPLKNRVDPKRQY